MVSKRVKYLGPAQPESRLGRYDTELASLLGPPVCSENGALLLSTRPFYILNLFYD